jgi:phage N-6-adenine-methyltransferase
VHHDGRAKGKTCGLRRRRDRLRVDGRMVRRKTVSARTAARVTYLDNSPLTPCLSPGGKNRTHVCETPQWFFDELNREFAFNLDVCALPENAKCPRYFTPEVDGLSREWTGTCWCNPPYGREICRWMQKAYEASQAGATVVCLLPARTDTAWFHEYAMKGEMRFVRGRLKFGDARQFAPFPSVVVIFRPTPPTPFRLCESEDGSA